MANEILTSGAGDLFASEVMAAEFLLLLADRDDLFQHPALVYAGAAEGSNVVKVPEIGLMGYDILSAGTEGSALSNTALTDSSTSITVAWYGKSYEQSDLAQMVTQGRIDPVQFARDAVVSVGQTLISLIANIADDFTATVGTSGVNATVQDFTDAITTLEIAKSPGPYLCVLHPRQWGDVRTDTLSLGGAVQHRQDSQAVVMAQGSQYKGQLYGVDVFTSSHVPTANAAADRAGGMWGRGGIVWADGMFPDNGDPNIMSMGRAALERVRTGKAGLTAYVTHAYMGVAQGIDAAGVSVITDA